jgi:branched-chain amino acid transport system permease protein
MSHTYKFKLSWIVPVILLFIFVLIPVFVRQTYILQILIVAMLYSYLCSSWNIIGGYAGQFALGNGVYIGIGAYVSAILFVYFNISPWIGMIAGGLLSVIFAVIISTPCFRLSGTYFSLATVAFLFVVRFIMLSQTTIFGLETYGGIGLIIPYQGGFWSMHLSKKGYYYLILALLALILAVSAWIRRSKMGYYLAAIQTNQGAASTIGVNVVMYKLFSQCISAFSMSIGGTFYAFFLLNVSPFAVFGFNMSLVIMIYCIIGGSGTLWGPVLGAMFLSILTETLRVRVGASVAPLATIFFGILLIFIVRFIPGGLIAILRGLVKRGYLWLQGGKKTGETAK